MPRHPMYGGRDLLDAFLPRPSTLSDSSLERRGAVCHGRAVTFLRLLVVVLMACSISGCQTGSPLINPGKYYRVRVTDPRGLLVADWIAEGYVARTEYGYRFRAVERLAGGAYPQRARYPYGRHVEATG